MVKQCSLAGEYLSSLAQMIHLFTANPFSIVLFIAPPSGIVFIQLLMGFTVILGMGLGWGWGVLTMKAALAARPQADTNARLAELQRAATQNTTNVGQLSGQTT